MKTTTNIPTSILQTDFYQFTMSYAYLVLGIADQRAGFESFIRRIKPEVAPNENHYIFKGENEVREFMSIVEKEINSSDFFDKFWEIFSPKFKEDKKTVSSFYKKAKKAFDDMNKEFEYTVVPNGTKVFPMVPVFQFNGPRMIGQMIETPITNIINGQTGFESFKKFSDDIETIDTIEKILKNGVTAFYRKELEFRANEYREATSKILFEAGFRRAGNFDIACAASYIAVKNGWNGTSNTCMYGKIPIEQIGGTMAHSFVMSFENEEDAFVAWNNIYPSSTILIDTYDSIEAVKKLIKLNIKPVAVRIDSEPIEDIAIKVRSILDNEGWFDVKIFLSGDITPEKLERWEEDNIPFDMCMAGTKYVNIDEIKHINSGFVYKLVEYEEDDGSKKYPYKKAFGKSNYPGLKLVTVSEDGNIKMEIDKGIGFENISAIGNNPTIRFVSDKFKENNEEK